MKYKELMNLFNEVHDFKGEIIKINNKLKDLQNIKKPNLNSVLMNGRDYYVNIYRMSMCNDTYSDFSKFIYDSTVSYFEKQRDILYEHYNNKMTELKSIIDKDKIVDFSEKLKELEI